MMQLTEIGFYLLLFITVTAALMVVTDRNIIHAALFLGLTLTGVAGLYLLLGAPFIAAAQVLIYVGAITVLILFALMLTGQRFLREPRNAIPHRLISGVIALVLFGVFIWSARQPVWAVQAVPPEALETERYLDQLAEAMLGLYVLPFEIVAVLLLVAAEGAVVLAKEETGEIAGPPQPPGGELPQE
jgi:NADH-quinone oxidoreductase subunit J